MKTKNRVRNPHKRPQPLQPLVWDGEGVVRFQANRVVKRLLDEASARGIDMNFLRRQEGPTNEDWEHFAQLIGYSVSGWGNLSYVSDKTWSRADKAKDKLLQLYPTDPAKPPTSEVKLNPNASSAPSSSTRISPPDQSLE